MRHRDFEVFRAERQQEPVTFSIRGKKFTLPADLPADIVLGMMDLQDEAQDTTDAKQLQNIQLRLTKLNLSIFTEKQMKQIRALQPAVAIDELKEILGWVFAQYGVELAVGNATAPESNTGAEST